MVFKPINLARQSLVKTFTHGYAQSLVAASQSSSASQNTFFSFHNNVSSIFGKAGPPTVLQNAFPNQSSSSSSGADAGSGAGKPGYSHTDVSGGDGGLAAYYAAWQQHQKNDDRDGDDWHQFQFAKRIGWNAPTTVPEPYTKSKSQRKTARPSRAILSRTRSASAVEGTRQAEAEVAPVEVSTVAPAVKDVQESITTIVEQEEVSAEVLNLATEAIARAASPQASPSEDSVSLWTSTDATSVSDSDHYTEHLAHLAETQQYAGVPPTFEAMLLAGVKPTASAYNALLLAAINIPRGKHQVVPRVLDVYADMMRRKVTPDTATYAVLVELLAARAMEVTAMKKDLAQRRTRFGGMESQDSFLFRSDQTELDILNEDDSLSIAIKLFDTSAAVATKHVYSAETYRLLISACAEQGRVSDMVRIFANMESHNIQAPTSIFSPMIQAFASVGDLKSAVDCYNEYKTMAILHDSGATNVVRKDADVYAAIVNAYVICGRTKDGLKFFGKLQNALASTDSMPLIEDTVGLQALIPQMLTEGRHDEALQYAANNLTPHAQRQAIAEICSDAADKDKCVAAIEAFAMLPSTSSGATCHAAAALMAMHIRAANVQSAQAVWAASLKPAPIPAAIEPTAMYALSLIASGNGDVDLAEVQAMFNQIRNSSSNKQHRIESTERIDEAIELMGKQIVNSASTPMATTALIKMMLDNGGLTPVTESLLALLGPSQLAGLSASDLTMFAQIEAEMLSAKASLDVAHASRFTHIVEMLVVTGSVVERQALDRITTALQTLQRPDLVARLQNSQLSSARPVPAQFSPVYSPVSIVPTVAIDDSYDPYTSSTDFKGSALIAEELEKTHGRTASHFNEAMARFRNMRRSGRHPRYPTYAKLINAAAKESRLDVATDILGAAATDIPLIHNNTTVRAGWVSIYDALLAAALTCSDRALAAQYHEQLLGLGAAPSANTYGLYITTLGTSSSSKSIKPLDEATTALSIFARSQSEGVTPTSFLYNALIGKLGKARRIDDVLFHFSQMRAHGIRPTSVTYGTVVNALCRVSDTPLAEQLFAEMEAQDNYRPRPAPYNSLMQHFLTPAHASRTKVLDYAARMAAAGIEPTAHTYKLLIDAHASLDVPDLPAAHAVLASIPAPGPQAVHYAALIHATGCVLHDLPAARALFDDVLRGKKCAPEATLYQALFEAIVANRACTDDVVGPLRADMRERRVGLTAYIANTLISGWSGSGSSEGPAKARAVYEELGRERREPSTYEAMARACLAAGEMGIARSVVGEAMRRGYPAAVVGRIVELVKGDEA